MFLSLWVYRSELRPAGRRRHTHTHTFTFILVSSVTHRHFTSCCSFENSKVTGNILYSQFSQKNRFVTTQFYVIQHTVIECYYVIFQVKPLQRQSPLICYWCLSGPALELMLDFEDIFSSFYTSVFFFVFYSQSFDFAHITFSQPTITCSHYSWLVCRGC